MIRHEINDAEVNATLSRLAQAMADMTPAMQEIGDFLTASTKDRFIQHVAPDGTPWAPKSQAALHVYAARGEPVDPRPLFGPSRQLSSQIFSTATPDSVEWGSSRIYAGTIQHGAATGAVFASRFCLTSSSGARKRRPPAGTSNMPVSAPSSPRTGRTCRD